MEDEITSINIESLYNKDIAKNPILSNEKQRQLVREYREGYKSVGDKYGIKTRLDVVMSLVDKVRKLDDLNISGKNLSEAEFKSLRRLIKDNKRSANSNIKGQILQKYREFAYGLQIPNKFLSSRRLVNTVNRISSYEDYKNSRITLKDFDNLVEKAKENKAKRDIMITSNLRLVFPIAKENVNNSTIPFKDLVQSGNEGLMKSTKKFDPDRGFKFPTYACWWIEQSIKRSIHDESKTVRTPVYIIEETNMLNKVIDEFERKGVEPTLERLSKATKIRKDKIEFLLSSRHNYIPLDDYNEAYGSEFYNNLEDSHYKFEKNIDNTRLNDLIDKTLNEKEKKVIDMRFYKGLTLEEVGNELDGVSRERARQLEEQSLRKLKHKFERSRISFDSFNQKL